jgi:S1-C subfamily serine protease
MDGAVNALDLLLLAVLLLAALSGFRRGLALQAFSFGGLLAGLGIGALLVPVVTGLADGSGAQATIAIVTLIAAAAVGNAAGWYVGARLRARAHATKFRRADAVGGSAVAVLASLLAIWFIALNLVNGPFHDVARQIRGSAIVRALDDTLPEPPSLLAQVRLFFNRFGFPDVFAGIPPVPGEPVRPPSHAEARAAFEAADESTVMVVGPACDRIQEGSGFGVGGEYVVTNAHVVAGVDTPHVVSNADESFTATTVLFDPELDLAVLFVDDAPWPSLSLAPQDADRGDVGAVLGYPGGGGLDPQRAAVLRALDGVIGHDIYGRRQTERSVLELQTHVRPGNSGGPFVLPDGTVAGVVFAASTTDRDVGYALAVSDVAAHVDRSIGETQPVGTGPCIR